VCLSATAASGASDAAPRVSKPGAADHLELADAASEKLVVPAPDAPELDATFPQPEPQLVPWAQPAEAAALCTPVVARFAARSCAAKESAARRAQADAARTLVVALKHEMEHETKLEMEPAVKQQTPKARLARPAPQAAQVESKSPEAQPLVSQPEQESRALPAQPAMRPAVQEPCSQPQLEPALSPPGALQPLACWQLEAQESPRADAPQAAPHALEARPQPLSAA